MLEVNAAQTGAANVQVQELALPPATTDSRAIGNDVFAHADGLSTDPTQPATITLRFSQADVMSTPLADVQVGAHQRRRRDDQDPRLRRRGTCRPGRRTASSAR